jgi:hypothetical protein
MTSDTRTDNVIPSNNFFDTLKSKQHNITLESLNKLKVKIDREIQSINLSIKNNIETITNLKNKIDNIVIK